MNEVKSESDGYRMVAKHIDHFRGLRDLRLLPVIITVIIVIFAYIQLSLYSPSRGNRRLLDKTMNGKCETKAEGVENGQHTTPSTIKSNCNIKNSFGNEEGTQDNWKGEMKNLRHKLIFSVCKCSYT